MRISVSLTEKEYELLKIAQTISNKSVKDIMILGICATHPLIEAGLERGISIKNNRLYLEPIENKGNSNVME